MAPDKKQTDFSKKLSKYMRRLGSKGGKRRSETLTPEERSENARRAALARWAKYKEAQRKR